MRIALVNPITQTVDRPKRFWSLLGRGPAESLLTDCEVNYVKLAQTIANLGHEVSLFISDCYKPRNPYIPEGHLKIHYLPTKAKLFFPPAYIPLLPSLYSALKEGNFDCIQTTELYQPSTLLASFACRHLFVWEELDQYFTRTFTRFLQKCSHKIIEPRLRKKVFVIPRSQSACQFLKMRGWENVEDVIPSPVDTDIFKPLSSQKEEYLLIVTRLAASRGLDFLLEVMVRLSSIRPDIQLLVVGRGPYLDPFKKEIAQRGLSQHIEIISDFLSHKEMNKVYNHCYMSLIVINAALYPFVASECMAVGKPVISRLKKGLVDLIQNGETGYLVDHVDEMVRRIVTLLEDDSKRNQMGKKGRERIMEYCCLKKVASRFIDTYKAKLGL